MNTGNFEVWGHRGTSHSTRIMCGCTSYTLNKSLQPSIQVRTDTQSEGYLFSFESCHRLQSPRGSYLSNSLMPPYEVVAALYNSSFYLSLLTALYFYHSLIWLLLPTCPFNFLQTITHILPAHSLVQDALKLQADPLLAQA